jgi:uncharacterized protein YdaU (DUF1376 family)
MTRHPLRRVDFYPDDWMNGTSRLTLEEEAAYLRVCLMIYSRGGPIEDDDRWVAGMCRVSLRKWRTLKSGLLDNEKITIANGMIGQHRCEFELEKAVKRSRKHAENGAKGGEVTAKRRANLKVISTVAPAGAIARLQHTTNTPTTNPSVTNETGDKAPVAFQETSPSPGAVIFTQCLNFLTNNCDLNQNSARTLLGRWRKDYGDAAVIAAVNAAAQRDDISEPRAWIAGRLKKTAKPEGWVGAL